MVAELRTLPRSSRMARQISQSEEHAAWGRVIQLTGRGYLSVVAERSDLSLASFSEIRSIASRRLRQLGDTDIR